jgi:hypothetical protein
MIKIGELSTKVDRLIDDVKGQSTKIDTVCHQITFVKGALWVIGFIIVAFVAIATWYFTGKLSVTIRP